MRLFLFVFICIFLPTWSSGSSADLFSYNEYDVVQALLPLHQLEQNIIAHPENYESYHQESILNQYWLSPDEDAKTAADSFFKGLTLGCFGVFDSYLSHDKDKYKRGPLWTGCCLNTLLLGTLYYLLDTNYFHLIPPGS